MARGGYREKAGRKTSWASGCKFEDTKIIRVPKAIADKLLDIAHKLDEGGSLDLVSKSKDPLNILENEKQLSILEPTQYNIYHLDDLIIKGKSIVCNETVVRSKDRGAVRKYFGLLLDVDRDLFK
jgi:hypothetical protein